MGITGTSRRLGLQGMGGIGKTVLATALARDEEVIKAFSDGVLWVTIGQTPDLLTEQSNLADFLEYEGAAFTNIDQGTARLQKLFANKACLLILDDIWDSKHLKAFNSILDSRSQMLITTRDASIINSLGAKKHELGVLSDKESLELLAKWTGYEKNTTLPTEAEEIVTECGNLPLALAMVGGMLCGKPERWEDVLYRLRNADLDKIKQDFPDYPYLNLLKAIQVSVEALEPHIKKKYFDFAIFPEDTAIPEKVLQIFWEPEELNKYDTQDVMYELVDKSLASRDNDGNLQLHDLQLDYIKKQTKDLSTLHDRFLQAYTQKYPNGWHTLEDDGYIYQHLSYHLQAAGREDELKELLLDFRWLEAKLENTSIKALIADYDLLTQEKNLQLVQGALRLSAHILNTDKTQLAGQLWGRLQCFDILDIEAFLQEVKQWQNSPWLYPLTANLTSPDQPLISNITDSIGYVQSTKITPDGKQIIAAFQDGTIKVWDLNLGNLVRTIVAHDKCINTLTTTSDGLQVVSGSDDKTIKIWNLKTGNLANTLTGHLAAVNSIVITPDNSQMISASSDFSLKVWDLTTGKVLHTLTGHSKSVEAVTILFSNNKKWIISAGCDQTLKVWNLETGLEKMTLNHSDWVWSIITTIDGKRVISGLEDGNITVWKVGTWEKEYVLKAHRDRIYSVAVTPDGKHIISGSSDGVIKIWKVGTWENKATFTTDRNRVLAVGVTPDGKQIISASENEFLSNGFLFNGYVIKVWNFEKCIERFSSEAKQNTKNAHTGSVEVVAFNLDGEYIISAAKDNTLKLWKVGTWENEVSFTGKSQSALSLGDSANNQCFMLKADEVECTLRRMTNTLPVLLASTTDGKRQIWASCDDTIKVWDVSEEKFITTFTGESEIRCCAISPDGVTIVAGEASGRLHFLRLE